MKDKFEVLKPVKLILPPCVHVFKPINQCYEKCIKCGIIIE
jgi:hypothetical protein